MSGARRVRRFRRKKTFRWIVLAIILCSAMSCVAPVLYATTDCSRWLAEYKQGVLQRRAARRLRAARYRLTAMVHRPAPPHHYPMRHRMSPLESLRRFQIDCGEIETPAPPTVISPPVVPPVPLQPSLTFISFAEVPPDLPPPTPPNVGVPPNGPPLVNIPTTPVENLPPPTVPAPVPEPASLVLALTGAGVLLQAVRRKRNSRLPL